MYLIFFSLPLTLIKRLCIRYVLLSFFHVISNAFWLIKNLFSFFTFFNLIMPHYIFSFMLQFFYLLINFVYTNNYFFLFLYDYFLIYQIIWFGFVQSKLFFMLTLQLVIFVSYSFGKLFIIIIIFTFILCEPLFNLFYFWAFIRIIFDFFWLA